MALVLLVFGSGETVVVGPEESLVALRHRRRAALR
jgi:hypothetical protein